MPNAPRPTRLSGKMPCMAGHLILIPHTISIQDTLPRYAFDTDAKMLCRFDSNAIVYISDPSWLMMIYGPNVPLFGG